MRASLSSIIVVALLLAAGGGLALSLSNGWFFHPPAASPVGDNVLATPGFGAPTSAGTGTIAAEPLGAHRVPPAGLSEYYSAQYRFSLFYPEKLEVKEYDEGGGASTITFQNVAAAQGFQIFVVPYHDPQVSEERFHTDVPSGVRKGVQNITIDGVAGASFYSTNLSLGETAEMWFIHGGYLFEVTTPKPLAGGLADIMQTWEFI